MKESLAQVSWGLLDYIIKYMNTSRSCKDKVKMCFENTENHPGTVSDFDFFPTRARATKKLKQNLQRKTEKPNNQRRKIGTNLWQCCSCLKEVQSYLSPPMDSHILSTKSGDVDTRVHRKQPYQVSQKDKHQSVATGGKEPSQDIQMKTNNEVHPASFHLFQMKTLRINVAIPIN